MIPLSLQVYLGTFSSEQKCCGSIQTIRHKVVAGKYNACLTGRKRHSSIAACRYVQENSMSTHTHTKQPQGGKGMNEGVLASLHAQKLHMISARHHIFNLAACQNACCYVCRRRLSQECGQHGTPAVPKEVRWANSLGHRVHCDRSAWLHKLTCTTIQEWWHLHSCFL